MENFAIIAIAAFIAILVLGPIFMVYLTRWCDNRKYHQGPRAFERALAKLREVVVVLEKDPITQSTADNPSAEVATCPICLAELYPRRLDREQVMKDRVADQTDGQETEANAASHGVQQANSNNATDAQRVGPTSTMDEVVSLKTCGHSFHSRCLTTWFMIDRLDCPVCRARYWGEAQPGAERPSPGSNLSPGPSRRTDGESSGARTGYWGVVVL